MKWDSISDTKERWVLDFRISCWFVCFSELLDQVQRECALLFSEEKSTSAYLSLFGSFVLTTQLTRRTSWRCHLVVNSKKKTIRYLCVGLREQEERKQRRRCRERLIGIFFHFDVSWYRQLYWEECQNCLLSLIDCRRKLKDALDRIRSVLSKIISYDFDNFFISTDCSLRTSLWRVMGRFTCSLIDFMFPSDERMNIVVLV